MVTWNSPHCQTPVARLNGMTVQNRSALPQPATRLPGKVHAIDGVCPHAGGPLAQGEIKDGVVTCPWHGWTFQACSGCSLQPAGNDVGSYPVKVEEGNIYLRVDMENGALVKT